MVKFAVSVSPSLLCVDDRMSNKTKKKEHLQLAAETDVITTSKLTELERRSGRDRRQGGDRRKDSGQLGTARGIETMFRNAYRAQLDLTALAATKANIMISVNGFILSVLLFSGAYFIVSQPRFLIPTGIFLLTCMISIIFAVLAARPKMVESNRTVEDFRTDKANVLVFEEFAQLSKEQFMDIMLELLKDNDRIYKNMAGQMYFLGKNADRKFRLLHISYGAFILGLFLCFISLLIVGTSLDLPEFIASSTLAAGQYSHV